MQGATNPAIDVTNLRGARLDAANGYLEFGGAENYARLLEFSRVELDGKSFRADPVEPPVERSMDVLFHLDDDLTFESVDAFDAYYGTQGLAKPGAPKIALITSVPGPLQCNRDHVDAFIRALEGRAWNVYPMASAEKRLDFLKRIDPDLVVLMPHGRLTLGRADDAIAWLRESRHPDANAGVGVPEPRRLGDRPAGHGRVHAHDERRPARARRRGGALRGGRAVHRRRRLRDLRRVARAPRHLLRPRRGLADLEGKPNRDKRVAIYYYKGPGKNAMNAGSLEVARAC